MEYQKLIEQIALEVLEQYADEKEVNNLINSMEKSTLKKETPLKSEAPLKAEAAEKQEAKEKQETINKPLQPISPSKMAEQGREEYMKYLHKKVSNYV